MGSKGEPITPSLEKPAPLHAMSFYNEVLEAIGEKKVENMTPAERIQYYYRQYTKANNGKKPCIESSEELSALAMVG